MATELTDDVPGRGGVVAAGEALEQPEHRAGGVGKIAVVERGHHPLRELLLDDAHGEVGADDLANDRIVGTAVTLREVQEIPVRPPQRHRPRPAGER